MSFLSKLLIKDIFEEFNFNSTNSTNLCGKINSNSTGKHIINSSEENDTSIIEHIDDANYKISEHEIKYKVFEDISAVSKKGKEIELILLIPSEHNVISINKIKISKKIKNYINDIFLCVNDKVTLTKEELYNEVNTDSYKAKMKIANDLKINNPKSTNINLHILLNRSAVNYIVNKDIFINYSYLINKNKIKYV